MWNGYYVYWGCFFLCWYGCHVNHSLSLFCLSIACHPAHAVAHCFVSLFIHADGDDEVADDVDGSGNTEQRDKF